MGIQFFPAVNAEGENWLTGWSFRQNLTVNDGIHVITVHYNSGNNVLGHIYLNGKCQPDFEV